MPSVGPPSPAAPTAWSIWLGVAAGAISPIFRRPSQWALIDTRCLAETNFGPTPPRSAGLARASSLNRPLANLQNPQHSLQGLARPSSLRRRGWPQADLREARDSRPPTDIPRCVPKTPVHPPDRRLPAGSCSAAACASMGSPPFSTSIALGSSPARLPASRPPSPSRLSQDCAPVCRPYAPVPCGG